MVRKWSPVLALVLSLWVSGCGSSNPEPAPAPPKAAAAAPADAPKAPAAEVASELPADLRHAGWDFYGFDAKDLEYRVTGPALSQPETSTRTVRLVAVENGVARYAVSQTGLLGQPGDELYEVKADGVYNTGIGENKFAKAPLAMPADPKPGAEWKSDMKLDDISILMTNRIVKMEKVKVSAGEYPVAMLVESKGDTEKGGAKTAMSVKQWYVRGIGIVKTEISSGTGATAQKLNVELVKVGK